MGMENIMNIKNIDKIINFTKSFANYASNGFHNSSKEVQDFRANICKTCENFNSLNTTCNLCGCYLDIKVTWANEKCPIDKWGSDINNLFESALGSIPEAQIIETENIKDCNCNKNV